MNEIKKNYIIILEPIYYNVIKKELGSKMKSKINFAVYEEYIKTFESICKKQKIIKKTYDKKIFNLIGEKNPNFKEETIFNYLDSTKIKYDPEELRKYGLSKDFSGSLIYSFLKFDFSEKYYNELILKELIILNPDQYSEKELNYLIEKKLILLSKIGFENYNYFKKIIYLKFEEAMELFIENENNPKEKLEKILKYLKILIKLFKREKILYKEKLEITQFEINSRLQRKYANYQNLKTLKKEYSNFETIIKFEIPKISKTIKDLKNFKNEIENNINDKKVLTKIFKILSKKNYYFKIWKFEIGSK